jgi:hypothetical protein
MAVTTPCGAERSLQWLTVLSAVAALRSERSTVRRLGLVRQSERARSDADEEIVSLVLPRLPWAQDCPGPKAALGPIADLSGRSVACQMSSCMLHVVFRSSGDAKCVPT